MLFIYSKSISLQIYTYGKNSGLVLYVYSYTTLSSLNYSHNYYIY